MTDIKDSSNGKKKKSDDNSEDSVKTLKNFDLKDSVKAVDSLSDELLTNIIRLENLEIKELLLRKILVNDNYDKIKDLTKQKLDGNKFKEFESILSYFEKFKERSFDDIFCKMPYVGLAVFFMPGTDDPVSVFYGDWKKNSNDNSNTNSFYDSADYCHYNKEHFVKNSKIEDRGRIFQISKLMRHMDEELDAGTHTKTHFFFWIKSFIDLQCMKRPYSIPSKDASRYYLAENEKKQEKSSQSLSLFINPYDLDETGLVIKLNDSSKDILLKWQANESHPCILTSPIYVNHDTFVLVASFFPPSIINRPEDESEAIQDVMTAHNLISHSIFEPLYNAILREGSRCLRESLGRLNVSEKLLEKASRELRPPSLNNDKKAYIGKEHIFTYFWMNEIEMLSSADFRSHIYGDILKKPEDIFETILDLEEKVYGNIKKAWDAKQNELDKTELGENDKVEVFFKNTLPAELPFANLLRNIEGTQRYLKMENRDHLIHQFQVFLLGAIFIKKHKTEFIDCFLETFKQDNNNGGELYDFLNEDLGYDWNNEDLESVSKIEYLLKLSWFLASVYHDIGYPVEAIDKVVVGLRKEVADLLSIDESYYKDSLEFKIDPVLYDDPRAYILLREVSYAIANSISDGNVENPDSKDDEKSKNQLKREREEWWYFFRYLAFEEKRHEFISVLTLGLKFAETNGDINDFLESPFGKFVMRNILMPIVLHHIGKWGKERSNKNNKYDRPELLKSKRDAVDSLLPKLVNIQFNFKEHPIAALLAFCDSIQETGRPSGGRKEEWPEMTEDVFDGAEQCKEGNEEIELYKVKYTYKGIDNACSLDRCQKDYESKKNIIPKLRKYFKFGPLNNICVKYEGEYRTHDGKIIVFDSFYVSNEKCCEGCRK